MTYPGYNPDACYKAGDYDAADLCAQWRASIAAEKAAHEARRATNWSIVATFLSALSLIAVGVALYLTVDSNGIARDTAKRQLRAYVSVEPCGINALLDGMYRVPIEVRNAGQTPAYNLELFGDFLIVGGDPRYFSPVDEGRLKGEGLPSDNALHPNGTRYIYAYLQEAVAKPHLLDIDSKRKAIIHYGYLKYMDSFGQSWQTNFAYYHWGEELSDAESKRCIAGNGAT